MKVRFGFVSNSSSTSFSIYGARIPMEEFCKVANINIEDRDAMYDEFECCSSSALDKHGLETVGWSEYSNVYVGASWENMKMDETRKQFQDRVEKAVKALFGEVKCEVMADTISTG